MLSNDSDYYIIASNGELALYDKIDFIERYKKATLSKTEEGLLLEVP